MVPAKNFSANSVNDSEVNPTPMPTIKEKATAERTPVQMVFMRLRKSILTKYAIRIPTIRAASKPSRRPIRSPASKRGFPFFGLVLT